MSSLSRWTCPIHDLEFIQIPKSTLTTKSFLGKGGRLRNKRVSEKTVTRQCPICIEKSWTKEDVYSGFEYYGDMGDDYRSGLIASEGISIIKAGLSIGIDYFSTEAIFKCYNIEDHVQGWKTFNEKWSLEDWNKSFRFETYSYYPNNEPTLIKWEKALRYFKLSDWGEDFKEMLAKKSW